MTDYISKHTCSHTHTTPKMLSFQYITRLPLCPQHTCYSNTDEHAHIFPSKLASPSSMGSQINISFHAKKKKALGKKALNHRAVCESLVQPYMISYTSLSKKHEFSMVRHYSLIEWSSSEKRQITQTLVFSNDFFIWLWLWLLYHNQVSNWEF